MIRHLVHKQKVELHVSPKADAYAFQNQVSHLLQNELLSSMESVFDSTFSPDKIIRIDTLRLDLGRITAPNFEGEFKVRFVEELKKSLLLKRDEVSGSKESEEVLSKPQSLVKTVIFFLENGYLPWYSAVKNMQDWEDELGTHLSEAEYGALISWLKGSSRQQPKVIERLVLQFSDKFLERILTTAWPGLREPWKHIQGDFTLIAAKFYGRPPAKANRNRQADSALRQEARMHEIRDKLWQFVFIVLLGDGRPDPAVAILELMAAHYHIAAEGILELTANDPLTRGDEHGENDFAAAFQTVLISMAFKTFAKSGMGSDDVGRQDAAGTIAGEPGKLLSGEAQIGGASPGGSQAAGKREKQGEEHGDRGVGNKTDDTDDTRKAGKAKADAASRKENKSAIKTGEVIYVNNSGMVILNPFLKPYFEDLKLVADGSFVTGKAHKRAVLLLHYLATGETRAAEFDLTLEKILCGYPPEDTLPAAIKLSKKEREESASLLKSLINYWEPLKTMSVEGLRGTFIHRDGKLELKDNGWLLTVEHKTVDVLLGKLPWGFSTIRLPWMQNMLSVDWC